MKVEVRMSRHLYEVVRADLARPHLFAAERLGFLFGKMGNRDTESPIILLHRYHPLRDDQYIDDPLSGGRMGGSAIRETMQEVITNRKEQEGVFHVHLHEHYGATGLSGMDQREIPELVRSFRSANRSAAHGLVILSLDHGLSWVWLPGSEEPQEAEKVTISGAPLSMFEKENEDVSDAKG